MEVIYSDTDSAYVIGISHDESVRFVERFNSLVNAKARALGCVNPYLKIEYQERFKYIVFPLGDDGKPSAKRYAARFEIYQGKRVPDDRIITEVKGLEFKRGDSSRLSRRMQKELVDLLMSGEDNPERYVRFVEEWRKAIFDGELKPEDIAISKGVKELAAYKVRLKKDGSPAPMPAQVRVAEKLRSQGENPFRVAYVITNASVSPMEIVPVSEYDGTVDRFHLWNKVVYPPSMRLLAGAFDTRNWNRYIAKRPKPALEGQLSLL